MEIREKEKEEQKEERSSSSHTEENSPQELEGFWVNTQESILGDRPYILPNGEVYKKRVRTVMSPMQSEALKKYFKINPFPSAETRAAISVSLEMKPRTVQIWFQNQRQKMKHILQEEEKIRGLRNRFTYNGEKGEETLWVLAHVSCAIFGTSDHL